MNRHSKEKDRTARPATLTGIKPQPTEPLQMLPGVVIQRGPAPGPEKVPALFSKVRPGVDPLTRRAWK